jgi:hypothetical protein
MEQLAANEGIKGVIEFITGLVLTVIPFLGAVAFLAFIWGIAKFIKASGSGKEIKDTKKSFDLGSYRTFCSDFSVGHYCIFAK